MAEDGNEIGRPAHIPLSDITIDVDTVAAAGDEKVTVAPSWAENPVLRLGQAKPVNELRAM